MLHKQKRGERYRELLIVVIVVLTMIASYEITNAQYYSDLDTVSTMTVNGYPGDTIIVGFDLINTFAVGGFHFRVLYDSLAFAPDSFFLAFRAWSFDLFGANFANDGVASFFGLSSHPLDNAIPPGSGAVAVIKFVINPYALPGLYTMRFEDVDSLSYENSLSNSVGDSLVIPIFIERQIEVLSAQAVGDEPQIPAAFVLEQNYPNPFNAHTAISFTLARPDRVRLDVLDMLGRKIATLYSGPAEAGEVTVQWDGINEFAHQSSSGVYYYRLQTSDGSKFVRRMTLLK